VFGKLVKADSLPGVGDRKESLVGGKVRSQPGDMRIPLLDSMPLVYILPSLQHLNLPQLIASYVSHTESLQDSGRPSTVLTGPTLLNYQRQMHNKFLDFGAVIEVPTTHTTRTVSRVK
jgi:hypothetical protein